VDVVPVDHLQLDGGTGVLLLEPLDEVLPVALGLVAVRGGDHLDLVGRGPAAGLPAALLAAACGQDESKAERRCSGDQDVSLHEPHLLPPTGANA
jgi:hypothetical protein